MWKIIWIVGVFLAGIFGYGVVHASAVHADYFNYPCNYPFVGMQGSVDILIYAGGQFCDGPMEINGSHYHCESGGGGIGGGALGFGPISGVAGSLNVGGFGGSGFGGAGGSCTWRCPDNTMALPPNPPAAWIQHIVVNNKYNDCKDHMVPAGFWSDPQHPESGPQKPGENNPGAPPPPPVENKPGEKLPEGEVNPNIPEEIPPSPLTPGMPMPLP